MVKKEILEQLNKLNSIDEKKKFLEKEIKKTNDKNEKLEIQRLIDELEKKEEHIPIEGQDLSLASPLRSLEVEEIPKYEKMQTRNLRSGSGLERVVSSETSEGKSDMVVYGASTSKDQNVIQYENASPLQQSRSGLERRSTEEGVSRNAIDSDPQIRAKARDMASRYGTDIPENIEKYVSGQEQRQTSMESSQSYQPKTLLRETNVVESIDRRKKQQEEKEDIDRYFVRPKGDTF